MSETGWISAALEDLRHHWSSAYIINGFEGRWSAERRDGKGVIRASTPRELLGMIRADYSAAPVPRSQSQPWRTAGT
jgi:hypothetical protein